MQVTRAASKRHDLIAALLAISAIVIFSSVAMPQTQSDAPLLTAYLGLTAAVVTFTLVPVEHGSLTLATIPLQAAAILLNPRDTLVVALIAGIASLVRRPGGLTMVAGRIYWTTIPELVRVSALRDSPQAFRIVAVIVMFTAANWIIVGLALSFAREEPIVAIWRRTFSRGWLLIIGYFALAVVLLVHVLDGSLAGYGFATIVIVLSFPLTDTVGARRARALLERQIDDTERHLLYSRAVEGVVHNLRNHLAAVKGHLEDVQTVRLDDAGRRGVQVAKSAADDALADMERVAAGAAPKVTWSAEPLDLRSLAEHSRVLAEPHARRRNVRVLADADPVPLWVRGDALLLREVITNLLLNALDASPSGGTVRLDCGVREDGKFLRVTDEGTGVAPEDRARLFEPHFTTKEHGTGMGLFVSYGIVREHQGRLLYEGDKRGAVFTVVLPAASGVAEPARISRPV